MNRDRRNKYIAFFGGVFIVFVAMLPEAVIWARKEKAAVAACDTAHGYLLETDRGFVCLSRSVIIGESP